MRRRDLQRFESCLHSGAVRGYRIDRRGALRLGAAATTVIVAPVFLRNALARPRNHPTPSITEGPFYPVEFPVDADADLLHHGPLHYGRGAAATVEGRVVDATGRPLAGAVVEIWQCDQGGHYRHPGDRGPVDPAFQGFGRRLVDAEGRYQFQTIRPAPYSGRTPHIHIKVKRDGRTALTTQLFVEGEPLNQSDFLWRRLDAADRAAVTVPFERAQDRLRAEFEIVLAT